MACSGSAGRMEIWCSAPAAASVQLRLPLPTCRKMEKLCSPCLARRSRTPAWSSACTRVYSSMLSGRSSMTWPRRRGCKGPQPPSAEMDASACSRRGGEKLLSLVKSVVKKLPETWRDSGNNVDLDTHGIIPAWFISRDGGCIRGARSKLSD